MHIGTAPNNAKLHTPIVGDALAYIDEIRGLGDALHPLVEALEGEAPGTTQGSKSQRIDGRVLRHVVLWLEIAGKDLSKKMIVEIAGDYEDCIHGVVDSRLTGAG